MRLVEVSRYEASSLQKGKDVKLLSKCTIDANVVPILREI